MNNPFAIEGPALISFSGGRTSGMMLYRILEAHSGKLPGDVVVSFRNTGKERTETLDFVHECETRWNVPIRWIEYRPTLPLFAEVNFSTAARNGEPFAAMVRHKRYMPNPSKRLCAEDGVSRRVLITGSRHWTDEEPIRELIDSLPDDTTVMFGDCPTGADHIAALLCAKRRLWTEVYYADWATHGKKAGPLRNQDMVDAKPTEAHAFPLDDSRGTWDCVRRCKAAGVPVVVHGHRADGRR